VGKFEPNLKFHNYDSWTHAMSTKKYQPKSFHQKRFMTWIGRILLVFIPLEILLSFLSIPPRYEAGVWYGNSYRERIALQTWPLSEDFNSLGYRDVEWGKAKTLKRVAVLGDSRFYGKYVSREHTFSRYITKNSSWESLNFGLTGASIYEATDFILDDAIQYQPDVVILCYDINSSLFSVMTREQGGSHHDVTQNLLRSSLIYTWLERFWYATSQEIQPIMTINEYDAMLTEVLQRCKQNNIHVILVIGWAFLEDFPELYTQERYKTFQEASKNIGLQNKVRVIDMNEVLQSKNLNQLLIGMEQMHLSEYGHRYMGQLLIDILMEEYHEP
jgi:hypothetical protein